MRNYKTIYKYLVTLNTDFIR